MNRKFIDLTGKVFGNLTVLRLVSTHTKTVHHSMWLCRCTCGKKFNKIHTNIIRGKNLGCHTCYRSLGHIKFRPFESRYNSFVKFNQGRANVNITYEQFLTFTQTKLCHYCGASIKWEPYKSTGYFLDRKNNNLGYSVGNCVVCCPRCNEAKSDHFNYKEWKKIGDLIRSWKK